MDSKVFELIDKYIEEAIESGKPITFDEAYLMAVTQLQEQAEMRLER